MKKEATVYHNPKYYPFGGLKEKVERDDVKLWEDKPSYQEVMGSKIFNEQVKKEGKVGKVKRDCAGDGG